LDIEIQILPLRAKQGAHTEQQSGKVFLHKSQNEVGFSEYDVMRKATLFLKI
jgi:hypothetical protein